MRGIVYDINGVTNGAFWFLKAVGGLPRTREDWSRVVPDLILGPRMPSWRAFPSSISRLSSLLSLFSGIEQSETQIRGVSRK